MALVNSLEVLKSLSDATSELIRKTSQSIVAIKAQMSRGTGVVLTHDGYIVTCNHVLAGCGAVKIGHDEKTLNAKIVGVVGEYVEKGVREEIEYEYYPTCFVVEPVGGELKKQDSEIQEMQYFSLDALPLPLAFEHEKMIKDYVSHLKSGVKP